MIHLSVWMPWYSVRCVCFPCEKMAGSCTCLLLYILCCDCVSNKVQLSCTVAACCYSVVCHQIKCDICILFSSPPQQQQPLGTVCTRLMWTNRKWKVSVGTSLTRMHINNLQKKREKSRVRWVKSVMSHLLIASFLTTIKSETLLPHRCCP